ncbi:MAG: hypothetical protein LAO20_14330 [Acidobacteriia bacterium]|nr:hypothetical protein [Terriglobia bacterium]
MPPVLTLAGKKKQRRLFLRELRAKVQGKKERLAQARGMVKDQEKELRNAQRELAKWKKARI